MRKVQNFKNSNKFRSKIHNLIPGGAHTYSKGDDQFPLIAPAAIDFGKGSKLWDLDGNKFLDCGMGLSSVSLGHAYKPVVNEVKKELLKGSNFQRPSIIELKMAEEFLKLVPQHDMIKFAKNGSTATTAAVKLARAKTGRQLIALPSEHPFYSYDDWFIGTTKCGFGVPKEIKNLSVKFKECNIESVKELFSKYPNQIACVITEPQRSFCNTSCKCNRPVKSFLKELIEVSHKNGALVIFDEMITGFKVDFPGVMTKYSLDPDMATWGKGIANGFSFSALTGKKSVMQLGGIKNREGKEKVFLVSTTHGAETHSLSAAIATIKIFKKKKVIQHNQKMGSLLIKKCQKIVDQLKINKHVEIVKSSWMVIFNFYDNEGKASLSHKTLIMQEMIKNGVLFQGVFIPCYSHSKKDVDFFVKAFNKSLRIYIKSLKKGVGAYLLGRPIKPVFRKII